MTARSAPLAMVALLLVAATTSSPAEGTGTDGAEHLAPPFASAYHDCDTDRIAVCFADADAGSGRLVVSVTAAPNHKISGGPCLGPWDAQWCPLSPVLAAIGGYGRARASLTASDVLVDPADYVLYTVVFTSEVGAQLANTLDDSGPWGVSISAQKGECKAVREEAPLPGIALHKVTVALDCPDDAPLSPGKVSVTISAYASVSCAYCIESNQLAVDVDAVTASAAPAS